MNNDLHFSSGKDDWETPDDLFQKYHQRYSFTLDGAANPQNAKLPRWYGPGGEVEDALSQPYPTDEKIWLNPPYSRKLQARFVKHAAECGQAGGLVVCLLPARTDTKLFHDICLRYGRVEFLRGRVKFKGAQHGAPFPSMIVIFGGEK